jgi:hypothetical protein
MAVTLSDTSSEPRHVLPSDHEYVRHALATQTSPRHPEPVEAAPVKPTLVIGDVHGHFDRLEALLTQEGILADCPDCGGDGDHAWEGDMMCPPCGGDGQRRVNFDVEVVQVGDLGHFGQDASPTGDKMCFKYAADWFDVVLWGNHDRAVVDSHHVFSGFLSPSPEIKHWMHGLYAMDKLKLAHAAHGWLITHAGVQANWKQQKGIDFDRNDPEAFAEWINENDWWPSRQDESVPKKWSGHDGPMTDLERSAMAVRDAISHARGGPQPLRRHPLARRQSGEAVPRHGSRSTAIRLRRTGASSIRQRGNVIDGASISVPRKLGSPNLIRSVSTLISAASTADTLAVFGSPTYDS